MLPASEASAPLGMRIAIVGVCSKESGIEISSTRTAENDTPNLVRVMLQNLVAGSRLLEEEVMQQRLAILISAASLAITAACSHSDAGITTAVKAKMAADSQVKASEINVDTHNRVVTLNGTVGSQT